MGLFKRLKRSSAATFWDSNKVRPQAYLFAALCVFLLPAQLSADSGVVSAVGGGHDTQDAISSLLKKTVAKHFKAYPAQLTKSVLQAEILPNASSFVQSYKIIEGGRPGSVSLSASVDLDVINALLGLSPKNLGDEAAKALILVRGPKLPDSLLPPLKPGATAPDVLAPLATAARDRLTRRSFSEATLTAEDMQAGGAGEDFASPELLRGLGAKAGARVALGIVGRIETYENENSHNRDERLVLSATIVDVKAGNVMGRATVNVANPKSRRDQYLSDLQKSIAEESKDLFQDIFVSAGRKLVKNEGLAGYSLVRVQSPLNGGLVLKFKTLLEGAPGVRSVSEHSIRRGQYDFAVRPAIADAALAKAVGALQSPELAIAVLKLPEAEDASGQPRPALTVTLTPKETGAEPSTEGALPNAKR